MGKYIQKFTGLFLAAFLLTISSVIAQAPLGFNYQGVALTNAGTPVSNKVISLRIALIESQQLGTVRYQEVHNVSTDAYGQFSVIIGNGQSVTGKMSDVQWSKFPYYMKVELDLTGGTAYVFVGTSQLLSVPYALYANNAGAASISVDSVKNELATIRLIQKGDSIVLNNNRGGVYIPKIDSLAKITSQLSSIKAGIVKFIKDSVSKIPAGLAIGYDALMLFDSLATNSANIAIGQNAGKSLPKFNTPNSNNDNILMGIQSGAGIGSTNGGGAAQNVMIGNYTGQFMNNLAVANVVIGHEAGRFSGGTIPNKSVVYNNNVSIGNRSLQYSKNAQSNVSIGADNLNASKDVSRNVAIGSFVANQYEGDDNVIIGSEMLQDSSSNGSKNVIIGSLVARNIRGSGNVILGYKAAADSIFLNTSNRLIIANDKTKTPLIYGEFDNKKVTINGDLTVTGKLNGSNNTLTDNFSNVFVGQNAGSNYQDVFKYGYGTNTAIGVNTLRNNTDYWNVAVGGNALSNGTNSRQNTAIGYNSMVNYKKGFDNVAVGYATLSSLDSGIYNTALGTQTLLNLKAGNDNTGLGYRALADLKSGSYNVAIGWGAGNALDTGSSNIFIGRYSGSDQIFKKINNKLIIHNSPTANPLIYGDFENRKLKFNANIDSLSILNRINFVDENANDHINKYDTGYSSPLIYSRYFYGHYGDLVIQGMSKTYTGNIHFVTGSNISGYDPPTQRMVIMDNGNVGIGNFAPFNPPTSKLQVTGNVLATGYKTPTGTSSQYLMADGSVSSGTTTSTVIPYTGATKSVDLGAFDMKVNGLSIGRGPGINNQSIVIATSPSNSTGNANTVLGHNAMSNNTSGNSNTIVGNNAMSANTTGQNNNAFGLFALSNNTTGERNTAFGRESLGTNVIGSDNVAVGNGALYSNKGNNSSVAVGINAMQYADDRTNGRTTGNTAVGYESLRGSTTAANNIGQYNSVLGYQSLIANTSGNYNSSIGYRALYTNTSGEDNLASGAGALYQNTTGAFNTAIGNNALYSNKANGKSIAIGHNAMFYADDRSSGINTESIAIGFEALKGSSTASNNTGIKNTSIGYLSMTSNTSGTGNATFGGGTLNFNTTGDYNVAIGYNALNLNTKGNINTAIGSFSMENFTKVAANFVGSDGANTAVGHRSLNSLISGGNNVAVGATALRNLVSGTNNNAFGNDALVNNLASGNNAFGTSALLSNTSGADNIAFGNLSLSSNTTGSGNIAIGLNSLGTNNGSGNNAFGVRAMESNTTGANNVAIGLNALQKNTTASDNTSLGNNSMKTNTIGSGNTALGYNADVASNNLSNATAIGNGAIVSTSNTIQLGNSSVVEVKTSGVITASAIGIGAMPNASAVLDINSTTKGFLPPRMTSLQRDAISSPALGLIVFCNNCSVKGQMQYFDGADWVDMVGNPAITGLNIGSSFQGGKIAYILQLGDPGYDPNRLHGIIAAISDQSTGIMWQQGVHTGSTTIFDVTNANGITIGTGKSNTDLIIAKQTTTSRPFAAAAIAIAHTGGGYSDWHLPSKDELNKLYINRVAIGGFTSNWYWSSTEKNEFYAESLNFDTGLFDGIGGYKGPGGTPYYVRAIRTF